MNHTYKINLQTVFGLTELTACTFFSLKNESEKQVTETVGFVQDHLEVKVVDENGAMVPFGKPGELCVRGYSSMLGYYNDEAKTKEIISNDKWLKTGFVYTVANFHFFRNNCRFILSDRFILQEDGYGRIVGRFKDMIIRGGENIFPKEIEDFLSTHPQIIEAQVIGVPDDRMGEEVCAFIRTTDKGSRLTQNDIKEFCRGSIAHFKVPRFVHIVNEFPRTASGKIQKFKLKEQFEKKRQS